MRILLLHNRYQAVGGAEYYLLLISKLLEAAGHTIIIASPEDERERISVPGRVEVLLPRARGARSSRACLGKLRAIVGQHRPDVAIVHSTAGFLTPLVLAGCVEILPTIKQVHDARVFCPRAHSKILPGAGFRICARPMGLGCWKCLWADRSGPFDVGPVREQATETLIRWGELRLLRRLPAVICGSQYMREELVRNRVPAERIHVVGHPLPWDPPPQAPPTEVPVVGAVGRWDRIKGMEQLLEVLLELAPKLSFRAELVGGGPGLEEAREQVRRGGLEERFAIHGAIPGSQLRELYRGLSVLAFPSMVPEAFGAAGIEAQAHGVPVVGYAAGGTRDWLIDGETGISLPMGDRNALAGALSRMLSDPPLAARLGRQAAERVRRMYDRHRHMESILGILRAVIDEIGSQEALKDRDR